MKIYRTAVLDTGADPSTAVAEPEARTIELPRGAGLELFLSVVTSEGVPVNLQSEGTVLRLRVRQNSNQWAVRPGLEITGASVVGQPSNVMRCEILPAQTVRWEAARYVYDVWLTRGSSEDQIVPLSAFVLLPSTRRP